MLRVNPKRFRWVVGIAISCWMLAAQAQGFRFNYVSFDGALPGYFFDPAAITNNGVVYGTAYDEANFLPNVAFYDDGSVTVLRSGLVYTANERGTIGGSVLTDVENFVQQAAIFRGDKVTLIPLPPGATQSSVIQISDSGATLVNLLDANFNETFALYQRGTLTPLEFGLPAVSELDINNQGIISGITDAFGEAARGFRHDTRTGKTTLLKPLPTEPHSWAMDINNRGDVLGYSFVFGGLERIGLWDKRARFKTYFVQGTPQFPTISNDLVFNDNNLIVITRTSQASNRESYLVPRPGVRLRLADLVNNLPSGTGPLWIVLKMNNHGDMIGFGLETGAFLLDRIGQGSD